MPIRNIIDLHCDTISECAKQNLALVNDSLAFSLDRLSEPFRLCQCMAVFMPDELRGDDAEIYFEHVFEKYLFQLAKYRDEIAPVFELDNIAECLNKAKFASILTIEGASVLNGKLCKVSELYDQGVRMMTLTWNAENELCGGSNTNIGFTDFGRAVVAEMEQLGMVVDVSHLSDAGFYELCEFSAKPFIASHSNSRAVCKHRRNLTDEMFTIIANRGGIVGINYYRNFLRDDGENGTIDDLLRHVHHFLKLGGEKAIALGSDFDGADVPDYISGIDKLGFLSQALINSGISATIVDNILFNNANNYFKNLLH